MAADAFLIGQLIAQLGLDSTQFQAGMTAAQAQMKAADAAMVKASASMQAQMTAVGLKMEKIGKSMSKFITLPILAIGAASFKAQKDFESSMSKIEGLVGVAAEEVSRLSDEVLKLAPAIGRGPEELADALFFVESAGIRGQKAMNVLEMSAKASVAGLGETKTIADLVTSAMNAYGSETLNASLATDILTAAVREGKAEATEMAGAIGIVLPIASEMGVKFDQVGAVFAGMTRTGTPAAVAATQLKAIMASLINPTEQAEEALNSMNLSSAGLRKQIREEGLIATLETLRKTTNQYGEEAMGKVFPNIRALMGVLDLMGANMEENIAISERMADSTGSLEKAFEAASKTTQFKWDQAISQVKTTFVKFGTAMKGLVIPIIEKFTERVKQVTDWLDSLSDAQQENMLKILGLTAAMGPLITIVGKLLKLISANPYVALAMAIVAVTMAVVGWVGSNRELFDGMSGIEKANKNLTKEFGNQRVAVDLLVKKIENENMSNEGRIKAINELKKIIPEYTGMLTDEGTLINHNTDAINLYLDALKEKIKIQIYEEEYTRLLKRQLELQNKIIEASIKASGIGPGALIAQGNLARLNIQYDKNAEAIEEMNVAAKNLNITLGQTPATVVTPEGGTGGTGTGGSGATGGAPDNEGFSQTQLNRIEFYTKKWQDSQNEVTDYFSNSWDTYISEIEDSIQKQLMIEEAAAQKRMQMEQAILQDKTEKAQQYVQIGQDIAYALGAAIGGGEGAFKSMVSTMLAGIDKIISALMAQAVAAYITTKAAIPGGLIAATVGVPLLIGLFNNLVPEFATGGLVYGETIGKLGEYPGASSNPEVIAPLSDLKKYFPSSEGGTGKPKMFKLVLDGRDASIMLDFDKLLRETW